MKPTEPDIKWCIEHANFVNGLLEKKGGAEHGDWFFCDDFALVKEVVNIASWEEAQEVHAELVAGGPGTVWLPSEGDVLAMLEEVAKGRPDAAGWGLRFAPSVGYRATLPDCLYPLQEDAVAGPWENTPRIALLELLRVVHE